MTLIIFILLFIFLIIASIISFIEHEIRASRRLIASSFLTLIPIIILLIIDADFRFGTTDSFISLILFVVLLALLLPIRKNKSYTQTIPLGRIDERNTMFSRMELIEGTAEFISFYQANPNHLDVDTKIRSKPGILGPHSSQFNVFQFASTEASFQLIEELKAKVDGKKSDIKVEIDKRKISNYIKKWSLKLGAADCGITELKDYHLYSVMGRAERYGKSVENKHDFAIAVTVEMDHEMLASAPRGSMVMESGHKYLKAGEIAIQIANFIRTLGYEARAHIDGNYEVVCALVARDAGLGDIGRIGILMTPKLGPRVRIAVVTTNMLLETDNPLNDFSMIDFCLSCKKCADSCPSKAIPFEDMKEINGVKRWQINQEACYSYWAVIGTDCGRCISVCPYAHPNNLMHNLVRLGNKNNFLFRKAALKLDDLIYGRKIPPANLPDWMDI